MRAFDNGLLAALSNKVVTLALFVKIVRADGQIVRFYQSTKPVVVEGETFLPARGVTVASIPFELNGAASRVDLNLVATSGATLDPDDIRNGLYDDARVTIYLADRNTTESLQNILFVGSMGQITLTERGYAVIECVSLLERAQQLTTEQYSPVCRADFGDLRCKFDISTVTEHVTVAGYDGGYVLTVSGLSSDATALTPATGAFLFKSNPAAGSKININGTDVEFAATDTDGMVTIGSARISHWGTVKRPNVNLTVQNLIAFLNASSDTEIVKCTYALGGIGEVVLTAVSPGAGGNDITISAEAETNATASGETLSGGSGAGGTDYWVNGQIIFRSGLLANQSYEIQASADDQISLFTPIEFAPQNGDEIDIIRGCDHSPFHQGCGRYNNIANYRGEPWCPGDEVDANLQWVSVDLVTPAPPADVPGEWPDWFEVADT